jgi:hypothetical protein
MNPVGFKALLDVGTIEYSMFVSAKHPFRNKVMTVARRRV